MRFKTFLISLLISGNAFANVIGSDAQNFAPTPDGIDFVTVHASETLEKGIVNFGLFFNYAVNTFPAYEGSGEAPEQSLLDRNDSFTSADLNFAIGLTDRLQVGISFPYVISQEIEDSDNLGRFEGQGFSETRPSLKYHLGKLGAWGFATAASMNFNRIINNPYVGEDAGPTTNVELVGDRNFGPWNFSLNFGHRWRSPGDEFEDLGISPLSNQWIYSGAASYLFTSVDTKLIFEIYGSSPTRETRNLSARQNSSLEALLGAKHTLTRNLALHAGTGREVLEGTSTPDWRVYTGLNYTFGPVLKTESPGIIRSEIRENKKTLVSLQMPELQFKFDSDELITPSRIIIDNVVKIIESIPNIQSVLVEGHTDSVGAELYNLDLSQRRAEAVINVLVESGAIEQNQISAIGYGESQPIADNGNFQGRQKNRRVEIKIETLD